MNARLICLLIVLISSASAVSPAIVDKPEPPKISELRLSNRTVYTGVSVRKLEADFVLILHESGTATIPYDLLSPSDAVMIGFNKEAVESFRKAKQTQATLQKASEADAARLNLILDLHFMHLTGTVIQVFPDGLLLKNCTIWRGGYSSFSDQGKTTYMAIFESEGLTCRVFCNSKISVDDSKFIGAVTPKGIFAYQNTLGAGATVNAYTTDLAPILDIVAKDISRPVILEAIQKRYDMPRYSFTVPEIKR